MKLKKLITICIFIPVCLIGCDSCFPGDYSVWIENNSNETISIYVNLEGIIKYPDTTLNPIRENMYFSMDVPSKETGSFIFNGDPVDDWMNYLQVDTLSYFIFSKDTLDAYPWEVIQKEYKIRQRYDLSLEDIIELDYKLTYPPSKQMRYMKMFPPYQE